MDILKKGTTFVILKHYLNPEYTGQIRIVQVINETAIFTGIKDDPDNELSKKNGGKGLKLSRKDWDFKDDGTARWSVHGYPIMDIKFL